jgi:tRNA dimethylallyltransferase
MQVYRGLDIGTAKPSLAERARVPHHLLDVVPPTVAFNAGRFSREARAAAEQIHERGGRVFLTGGTGLYIRAFLEGLIEDGEPDPAFRAHLEREAETAVAEGDPERLHRRLAAVDAVAAQRIHPNDRRRTIRALELVTRIGVPASQLRASHDFADRPYRALYLVLDPGRDELDERIDARAAAMIQAGLLQECRALREEGYGPELRPMQAIGYRHLMAVVDGQDTLDNALAGMRRDTRHFARRQRTWFRGVRDAVWITPDDPRAIESRVQAFLEGGEGAGRYCAADM